MQTLTLYGVPHSMFTGRARSYLIKLGVPYRELPPTTDHYRQEVVPRAGGRATLPTIEFDDGDVIRDNALIADHFEAGFGQPFTPAGPKQQFVSLLFAVIGAEGMYRPALHYRWNFADAHRDFFQYHFETFIGPAEGLVDRVMEYMQKSTRRIGVTPETIPVVEAVYLDQLKALDRHFAAHGYLLGGRPCIGDFSMMSPLFGHLGRDPAALALMHTHGPRVLRWVERMNRQEAGLIEYENRSETWCPDGSVPDTLLDVLRAFAEDFVPETLAAAEAIDAWIAAQDELAPGTACERGAGTAEFEVRGITVRAVAQPYRFFLLKRLQDARAAMQPADGQAIDELLDACGMTPVLGATLGREVAFRDNLEVWC